MKKILSIVMAISVLFASCQFAANNSNKKSESEKTSEVVFKDKVGYAFPFETEDLKDVVENYVIVKTYNNFDVAKFTKAGFTVEGKLPVAGDVYTYWYLYKKDTNILKKAFRIDGVLHAEYDRYVEAPKFTVNKNVEPIANLEDGLASVYGITSGELDPVDRGRNYNLAITKAQDAYKECGYGPDENKVYVAIIDTGTNMKHNDLKDVVLYAKSCQKRNDTTANPETNWIGEGGAFTEIPLGENWDLSSGHGSHCSGTICAKGENAEVHFNGGINGVAWKNTKLISYQGLGASGGGRSWSIYGAMLDLVNIVDILRKAPGDRTEADKKRLPSYLKDTQEQITQKTVPVNMSLGGSGGGEFQFYAMMTAIKHNVLPVIAMGNEGAYTNSYPAAFPGVLAVGATTGEDNQAPFSTRGSWISICAPGLGIESCGNNSYRTDFVNMSGTSMATPFVTGTIGYLLSFDAARQLSPYQIKVLLEETADKIDGATGWTDKYGHGRVNVLEAAKRVKNNTGIPAENAKYNTAAVKVSATNNGKPATVKLLLVEKDTKIPVYNVGMYKGDDFSFYGLKVGKTYVLKARFEGETQEQEFTVNGTEQNISFAFSINILWVSTVPNLAYNGGKDETDTSFAVYEANDDGSVDLTKAPIMKYDMDYLDSMSFKYTPGKKYYVVVNGFVDNDNFFRGGNYAVRIGPDPLDTKGVDAVDGTRKADENDSHEDDNTPAAAMDKGNAYNQIFGCNLVATGVDAEGKANIDPDWFYIETPLAP